MLQGLLNSLSLCDDLGHCSGCNHGLCPHTTLTSSHGGKCAKGNDCLPPETGGQALASLFRPLRFYVVHLECLCWFLGWLYPLMTADGTPCLLPIWSHALTHASESKVLSATFLLLYSSQQAWALLIFQPSYFWDHAVLASEVFTCGFGCFYYSFSLSFLKPFCPYVPESRCFLWRCCIMLRPRLHVGNFLL